MVRVPMAVLRGILAAAALAASSFAAVSAPAAAEQLKLAYVEFPPFTHTEGAKPVGSLFDMFEKVAADAGYTYTAQAVPPRRLFQALPEGEFDVFMGVKSPESFKDTTVASLSPIARIELHSWAMGEAPEIRQKEDLSGHKVIVLSGYSYGGWRSWMEDAANKVELVEARTAEQAVQLLTGGRGDFLLQYTMPMEKALGGKVPDGLQSKPISGVDLFFVVSKKHPEAAQVLSRLEASLAKLKAAGKL
jgi:polar amino acid transport system substrate-binding protein